jgi:small subunit ribosomal protein S8
MSMSDPIADLLTRIRNAQMVAKPTVSVPSSNLKVAIAQVLKDEGYIDGFQVKKRRQERTRDRAEVLRRPSGDRAHRARQPSRPARLQGRAAPSPRSMNGLGVAIVTTPQGVMTDRKARATGIGGEVLCYVA